MPYRKGNGTPPIKPRLRVDAGSLIAWVVVLSVVGLVSWSGIELLITPWPSGPQGHRYARAIVTGIVSFVISFMAFVWVCENWKRFERILSRSPFFREGER